MRLESGVIQDQLFATLNTPGLEVENSDILFQTLLWYVEKKVDFIDAFDVAWMQSRGIQTAFTFDRKHFSRFEGISVYTPDPPNDRQKKLFYPSC